MTTVTPFTGEFFGKTQTIYSINNTNPSKHLGGHMTTAKVCPKCRERNVFRLYEPKEEYKTDGFLISVYDCKCPSCKNDFEIKYEFDLTDN